MVGHNILRRYETFRPFTKEEAWGLFRIAAFAEAFGWTMLITGISLKQFVFHGNDIPVQISGRVHGSLFILYFVAPLLLYPSLRWHRAQALLAIAAGVPPYGSLLFEMVVAHNHRKASAKQQLVLSIYRHHTPARLKL